MVSHSYLHSIIRGLVFFMVVCWSVESAAQRKKVHTWGIQCFLKHKVGECKAGRPLRMEVRATSPALARKLANAAGQRRNQWNRCFRVARTKRELPTCDPRTGRTIR